jgi:hypothetical protein
MLASCGRLCQIPCAIQYNIRVGCAPTNSDVGVICGLFVVTLGFSSVLTGII